MSAEAVWLLIAAACAAAEVLTLTFVLGLLSVAALLTAGAALLGAGTVAQIAVFAVSGTALTVGVAPIARRHRGKGTGATMGVKALEGRSAVVLEPVTRTAGRVKIGGETWAARPLDPTQQLATGTSVAVAKVDGATLVVYDPEV